MKNLKNIKEVYFIGIGGIGMSALARYFRKKNKSVSGYDRTETPLTRVLQSEGIDIHFHESAELIGEPDLIIYTPAIPEDSIELKKAKELGVPLLKRSEVLGLISNEHDTYAVAGTHGKTTISTMLAHILYQSSIGCNAFLGGISANYNSNYLQGEKRAPVVMEADEFDRSFHQLSPSLSLISSVDPDHLDVYETPENMMEAFQSFANLTTESGACFIHQKLKGKIKPKGRSFAYSLNGGGKFYAKNIELKDGAYHFDLQTNTVPVKNLVLGMPGLHNIENAVAASAMAIEAGVSELELRNGLKSFQGIKRRFEIHVQEAKSTFIDDYAHHPTEIDVCINSAREMYPKRKLTVIFQPHLFSRTRDHLDAFAESLSACDKLILLDIYPAREKPIKGINSSELLKKVSIKNKKLLSKEDCLKQIAAKKPKLLLSLGAGDISEMVPALKEIMSA